MRALGAEIESSRVETRGGGGTGMGFKARRGSSSRGGNIRGIPYSQDNALGYPTSGLPRRNLLLNFYLITIISLSGRAYTVAYAVTEKTENACGPFGGGIGICRGDIPIAF